MELLLKKRELLDLGDKLQGIRIVCNEGRCWITQTGDSRDHMLGSGGSYNVYRKGQLIITATEPCRLMLSEPLKQGKQPHPEKSLYGQLIGKMAQLPAD